MATDYTVVEAKIRCATCNCRDVLYLRLEKNQMSTSANWTCPDCHNMRIITIRRAEPETAVEKEKEPVKNYIEKNGKRIQVDENGDPIEKSEHFLITAPKTKAVKKVSSEVSRIE